MQSKTKLFFFLSQEWQRRTDPPTLHQTTVPTALERQGDFSQSVDSSGNPYPYIRDSTTGLPCGPTNTSGCFQDGGVLGRIPANRLYAPGLAALNIFPQANFSGGSGLNYTSQVPDQSPRREDLLRMDYQVASNWRITGRYMNNKEDITQAYGPSVRHRTVAVLLSRYVGPSDRVRHLASLRTRALPEVPMYPSKPKSEILRDEIKRRAGQAKLAGRNGRAGSCSTSLRSRPGPTPADLSCSRNHAIC